MSGVGAVEVFLCTKLEEQPEAKNATINKSFGKGFIFLLTRTIWTNAEVT
jgi:hypothetical protein